MNSPSHGSASQRLVRPAKLEHFLPMSSLVDVKWLKMIAVAALLGLWLGASNHCSLEQIPGLNFLVCCDHEEETAPHQDSDCETDGCALVEDGLYKTEDCRVVATAPLLGIPAAFLHNHLQEAPPPVTLSGFLTFAPPELPASWQFAFRTALPVRAPSAAS